MYDGIVFEESKVRKLLISQLLAFVLLIVFCFEYELGISFTSNALLIGRNDYYPWTVRIVLCGLMIMFDCLLVLYFARIVRVYRLGVAYARPTWPGDALVVVFVAILCGGYIYTSIDTASRLKFHIDTYLWIGRFFIQISNFFYITLEIGGALLIWFFLRQLVKDEKLKNV